MFVWTLEYSEDAERDFELIFDHLFDAYVELGDSPDEAVERTAERIRKLRVEIDRLVDTPYIGTLRPDINSGIRFLRRDKAAIWFLRAEHSRTIIVAAIFYGAQDHIRNMLARMLAG
ncbi:type II toxin-antitoxin system RelE/ParE family toxin [Sinorhizobium meliloti]|uniref:type II toxin-antitoxin system RelE/ParE family toxin n=1 Tax=Rhizobium meliloti TaxID=382 RepID=UPI000FDAE8D1|nr:type II toxin-antitoxin system RelE/ParE family toxin [Sinorhizobium meliloti]MDW9830400.1 type II toxin-antitoxin system RelE/ParE family toxin [Sinorhizobium meliloti]RVG28656.1 type II toxin-antitoxin system RelE/ParE family toxin [Sinorhizobium meliloti]